MGQRWLTVGGFIRYDGFKKEKKIKYMFIEMRYLHIIFELYLETLFSYELYSH